jgi:nucleotide-binding universal stress UspA family protein
MRVLIAIDGSEGSFEALDQVVPLLRADRDQVVLYCRPPQVEVHSANVATQMVSETREFLANKIFSEARRRMPVGLAEAARTIVGHQDPRRGIILAAQQSSAELIVLGARGLSRLQRLLLGSVSRAVVHAADIPVWIARPRTAKLNGPRVLLASESPENAAGAARLLTQLAWPADARFSVMTVIHSIFAGAVPLWLEEQSRSPDVEATVQHWVQKHDEELRGHSERMQAFIDSSSAPLRGAHLVITEGDPAESILAAAAQEKSDLVVVGTRQKWSLGNEILGSVSEAVLNHMHCSVLVVPRAETP